MLVVPDWAALVDAIADEVRDGWESMNAWSGGRRILRVQAKRADAVVGTWEAVVDADAPDGGERVMLAAVRRLVPRAGYPFEGTIEVLADDVVIAVKSAKVSRASAPATVRVAELHAQRDLLRTSDRRTREMLEMHKAAPEVLFAAAAVLKESRELRVEPPKPARKLSKEAEERLAEIVRGLLKVVVGGGEGPGSGHAGEGPSGPVRGGQGPSNTVGETVAGPAPARGQFDAWAGLVAGDPKKGRDPGT
ncbi:MAG: hypothetical protein ACOZNI_07950 [Myxococcota bacterium]